MCLSINCVGECVPVKGGSRAGIPNPNNYSEKDCEGCEFFLLCGQMDYLRLGLNFVLSKRFGDGG